MKLLLKNCTIVDAIDDYSGKRDILINEGIIEKIEKNITVEVDETIDTEGFYVMPGFIDAHVHLREPGFEKKETVRTGSKAAAKGGYTSICCMPNTNPVTDSVERLNNLMEIIKKDGVVNVFPIASVTIGEKGNEITEMAVLKNVGAIAFSDDGRPIENAKIMRNALKIAKEKKIVVMEHCEDLDLAEGGVMNEGEKSRQLGLIGIPALSEELPIMRNVMIAKETNSAIHIAHISTAGSAEIIRKAKQDYINVTCEVTPHHISLTEDIIEDGFTDCKVNPPLRTKNDVEKMKQALRDNTIDLIATDHAPHHIDDKGNDFYSAANGISGIETAFAVCYTELVMGGYLTIKQLINKMSYNPSTLLGLDRGRIKIGKKADITIVDLNKKNVVNKEDFLSLGKNTPFHGRSYYGEVQYTIVNGKIVYSIKS